MALTGVGNALANVLAGNTGDNTLDGGGGGDTMVGGAGNDTYIVDNVGDVTSENAGAGVDLVVSSVSWTLASDVENLVLAGAGDLDGTGNALANVLTGNDGQNHLNGGAGDDLLYGAGGDDTLDGGAGNDTLRGGSGNSVYLFGRGDGQDRIWNYADTIYAIPLADPSPGKHNTLLFKAGVARRMSSSAKSPTSTPGR